MEETLRTDGQTRASVPELDGCLGGERLLGSEFGARGRRSASQWIGAACRCFLFRQGNHNT